MGIDSPSQTGANGEQKVNKDLRESQLDNPFKRSKVDEQAKNDLLALKAVPSHSIMTTVNARATAMWIVLLSIVGTGYSFFQVQHQQDKLYSMMPVYREAEEDIERETRANALKVLSDRLEETMDRMLKLNPDRKPQDREEYSKLEKQLDEIKQQQRAISGYSWY
jgi:hypothetical protein